MGNAAQARANQERMWWRLGARELAAAIVAGEVTARQAVEAAIERIEAVNPELNAVCWKRYDAARAEAAEADRRLATGETVGPLHGVPITVKECLDLAGSPSTFGIPSRAGVLAAADDVYVARLRRAGAIVLGKTNVAQLLFFFETDNPLYGRSNNPWSLERTPGGSSGGQAAIVAAGGVSLGLGTDLAGSNRVPAAFCGVVGYKPTAGRTTDAGKLSAPIGQRAIVSQVGMFGREVADVALAFSVAAETAPIDLAPRPLRVGWYDDDGTLPASPAARRAVREAAEALASAGATVTRFTPPPLDEAVAICFGVFSAGGADFVRRALGPDPRDPRIKMIELAAGAGPRKRALLAFLSKLTGRGKSAKTLDYYGKTRADDYFGLVERQLAYQERWLAAAAGLDVVLSPAAALPAVRHGATLELMLMGGYTAVYNVLGWPAGVVPFTRVRAGEESDRPASKDKLDLAARASEEGSAGLPIAVQVAARPGADDLALAAMAAVERAARARPDHPRLW